MILRRTHGYLMAKDEKPMWTFYGTELSVNYILTEYLQYQDELNKLNTLNSQVAVLGPNAETTYQILTFLRKSNLFDLI